MELKQSTIEELGKIMANDYASVLNVDELSVLGLSLLKVSKLAVTALARADEKQIVHSGKGSIIPESNTSQ